jgi:hypothetical protein
MMCEVSVLLFRGLLLSFPDFSGKADDHIVRVSFPIDCDISEFATFDSHVPFTEPFFAVSAAQQFLPASPDPCAVLSGLNCRQ